MEKVSLLCGPLESQLIVKVQYKSEPKLAHSRQRDPGEVLLLDIFKLQESVHNSLLCIVDCFLNPFMCYFKLSPKSCQKLCILMLQDEIE